MSVLGPDFKIEFHDLHGETAWYLFSVEYEVSDDGDVAPVHSLVAEGREASARAAFKEAVLAASSRCPGPMVQTVELPLASMVSMALVFLDDRGVT